jgi:hypothetical protein
MNTHESTLCLDFAEKLFERMRETTTDVHSVRDTVERLAPFARAFPEVRFCKGLVLPAVSEVAHSFLSQNYGASSSDVYSSLRCEGFENLCEFYEFTESRTGFCGSPWNRDKQEFSKDGGRMNSTANPDFAIWYSTGGNLRVVGEVKYHARRLTSRAVVESVLADLRYYLAIKSCSHSNWGHDFGFGVAYCAGGDQPRKSELIMDYWESDRILIAYFAAA